MIFYLSGKIRKFELISTISIIVAVILCLVLVRDYYENQIKILSDEAEMYKATLDSLKNKISMPRYPFVTNYEKTDYHDRTFMEIESSRLGPGEQGRKYLLTNSEDIQRNQICLDNIGLSCVTSDTISVNRSVPDVRLPSCDVKFHLKHLPKVSIIVIFYNEYWSVLLRAIHSIYNRTPHNLIHDFILINDGSTLDELHSPLEEYIKENFKGFIKMVNFKERRGLVNCRLEGARLARGEILIFLDAQIEVNVNWLPPLIEPIGLTPRIITTPIVDFIDLNTFEYVKTDDGGRSIFNWDLRFRRFPRRPQESVVLDEPIPTPVMIGSAFAINRQFFWDLGSYDDGLKVWSGEHLELSFRAQLCGNGIIEIPCSRVAHSYRFQKYYARYDDNGEDFMMRNLKRVAEIWMDDYKEIVYKRNPKLATMDPGDMLRAKAIKRGLHCKPFQYFIEYVAPDFFDRYPIDDPGCFAQGGIQSKFNSKCLEVLKGHGKVVLGSCERSFVMPSAKQFFRLSFHRNLQHFNFDFCLQDTLRMADCHYGGGNQFWKFDIETSQIVQAHTNSSSSQCLAVDEQNSQLSLVTCNSDDVKQKWNFGEKNVTALANWNNVGIDLNKLKLLA